MSKKGVEGGVKKWWPLIARLVGASLLMASLSERSNWRATRVVIWRRSGYVADKHEALKRVATAPLATGMAVELLRSQV